MDKRHVEAALFVSKTPMTIGDIAKVMGEDEKVVMRWILELKDEYKHRGMTIKQVAGGFEMVSSPDCIDVVQQIVPKEYENLPRSAMDTLAIVAYKQPVKRSLVAKLRGVLNPDHGLTGLIDRHLITETEDGFITTDEFLNFFAINDLRELPEIIIEDTFGSESDMDENMEDISENQMDAVIPDAVTDNEDDEEKTNIPI